MRIWKIKSAHVFFVTLSERSAKKATVLLVLCRHSLRVCCSAAYVFKNMYGLLFCVSAFLAQDNAPEAKPRPPDMYCINCNSEQRRLLDRHNELRRQAGASNMNELVRKIIYLSPQNGSLVANYEVSVGFMA